MPSSALIAVPRVLDSNTTHNHLKALVVAALESWQQIVTDPASQVVLTELTEGGTGKTIKFYLHGVEANPSAVVLHVRSHEIEFRSRRMAAAQASYSMNSVAPVRLAEGDNWYVDPFCGEQATYNTSETEAFAAGTFVARMHSSDTSWFRPFRGELLQAHPGLEAAVALEPDHWMWQLLARTEKMKRPFALPGNDDATGQHATWPCEVIQRFCDPAPLKPRHFILNRVVPFHGDLHCRNIIQTGHGPNRQFNVIDFEFAGVGPAVIDLAKILRSSNLSNELQTKLLEGYFHGLGLAPPTKEDVSQILFDCALHEFGVWKDDIGLFDIVQLSTDDAVRRMALLQEFAMYVRSSPQRSSVFTANSTDIWEASPQHNGMLRDAHTCRSC